MNVKTKEKADAPAAVKASAKTPASKPAVKKAAPETKRVMFGVRAEVGSKVFLAGDFNNWDPAGKPLADKNNDGNYTVAISLLPGSHQYKFVIDGTWCVDPEAADWSQNEHGTLNSVKHVN